MQYINEIPKIWQKTDFQGFHSGYITTAIKKTNYGFKINRFSNYVSLLSIKFEVLTNGFAKATVKVDTNYRPKYQYTLYFDKEYNEIKEKTTKLERKKWLELQK